MVLVSTRRQIALAFALVIFSVIALRAQNAADKNAAASGDNNLTETVFSRTAFNKTGSSENKDFSNNFRRSFKKNEAAAKSQDAINVKMKEWGFYAGSFTVHKDLKGESQKAPVVLFGVRHAWSIKNNENRRFRYYMDLNPLIIVNYRERRLIQTSPTTTAIVGERKTVFGVGFVPLGLQYNWRNNKKYQPYIAGGMGVALFNKRFPDNRSPLASTLR